MKLTPFFVAESLGHPAPKGASAIGAATDAPAYTSVVTDSRKITPGCLFVALPGERFDGNDFVEKAIEGGATGILCLEGRQPRDPKPGVDVFAVPDTVEAFRKLGAAWRRQFHIPIVAVAGSVGKTTTKELLATILEGKWDRVLKTQGSQNGYIGIPTTLLQLQTEHQAAVIEIGIDEIGAMKKHIELVAPSAAVLTAIGPEHLEKLVDVPTVAREETLALTTVAAHGGKVAILLDDPWISPLAQPLPHETKVGYTLNPEESAPSDLEILRGRLSPDNRSITFGGLGLDGLRLDLPLQGRHNATNLMSAVTIARMLGLSAAEIQEGLRGFQGAGGRSEIQLLPDGTPVICDYYNANPTSMAAGIRLLGEVSGREGRRGARWACLADMLELGPDEERFHRELAPLLLSEGVEHVLLFGPRMLALQDELRKTPVYRDHVQHFSSHEEMARTLATGLSLGDTLLIKGSRGMRMEEVLSVLRTLRPPRPGMAHLLAPTPENLRIAADALLRGEIVGIPTETVYGLAGVVFDTKALTRIFEAKERPTFDPLIVHVAPGMNLAALEQLQLISVSRLNLKSRELAEKLMKAFWPGPLTLVLPKHSHVPDLATSGLPSVALRCPRHPVAQELLRTAGVPLAAPSANRFGKISPTRAEHVLAELGDRIPWVLDGGPCEIGLESTVVLIDIKSDNLVLLRPGGTPASAIESVTGAPLRRAADFETGSPEIPQASPGMLKSHYAPAKPLFLLPSPLKDLSFPPAGLLEWLKRDSGVLGLLLYSGDATPAETKIRQWTRREIHSRTLSPGGQVEEAAHELFSQLRALDDDPKVALIVAEPCPVSEGLGFAIQDRLNRAASVT